MTPLEQAATMDFTHEIIALRTDVTQLQVQVTHHKQEVQDLKDAVVTLTAAVHKIDKTLVKLSVLAVIALPLITSVLNKFFIG